jgi:hypothetical protein
MVKLTFWIRAGVTLQMAKPNAETEKRGLTIQ